MPKTMIKFYSASCDGCGEDLASEEYIEEAAAFLLDNADRVFKKYKIHTIDYGRNK